MLLPEFNPWLLPHSGMQKLEDNYELSRTIP
jgi:hypothetical protein